MSSNNFPIATRFFSNTEVRYEALPRTPNTFGMRHRDLETMGKLCPIVLQDSGYLCIHQKETNIKNQMPNNISNIQSWVIIISCHIKPYHIRYSFTSNHITYHENIITCQQNPTFFGAWSSTGSRPRPHRSPGEKLTAAESYGNPHGNPFRGEGKILIKMGECLENDVKKNMIMKMVFANVLIHFC